MGRGSRASSHDLQDLGSGDRYKQTSLMAFCFSVLQRYCMGEVLINSQGAMSKVNHSG